MASSEETLDLLADLLQNRDKSALSGRIESALRYALSGFVGAPLGSLRRNVLSGPYSALDDWRTALAAVRNGTGNARMIGIGDSTSGGTPTSFLERAADQWAANRLANTRRGCIFPTDMTLNSDGRVVYGAGWANAGIGDFGPANRGLAMGSEGGGGTLDIGPVSCDRFEIWYLDAIVGSFDWWIDGGAHTTVNVGATSAVPTPSAVTSTVTAGTHTLHIGNVVGGPIFIYAIEPRTGTAGLYVGRETLGSTTSTMWTSVSSVFASSVLTFHSLQPDLTVIMLGVGDINLQVPLATFRANIDAMVVLGQTYGSVVLAVAPKPIMPAAYALLYENYIAQLESIRDARSCGMLDFTKHFQGLDSSEYMSDTLHPSLSAQAEMSMVLAAALMP